MATERTEDAPTLRLLAHSLKPEIYASEYHQFLSQCLLNKAKEKEKLTLGDTQRNFRECNEEWKKLKKSKEQKEQKEEEEEEA
jgi:hypothetical protein